MLITVLSFVVMAVLAGLELDPVLQIFGPLGGLGILALAILWLLTTISVVIFFRRRGGSTSIIVLASVATLALAAAAGAGRCRTSPWSSAASPRSRGSSV